jgi:hypothetical protein
MSIYSYFIHRIRRQWLWLAFLLAVAFFPAACKPGGAQANITYGSNSAQPLELRGKGAQSVSVQWSGPAILHISAGQGNQTFTATLSAGLDYRELASGSGPLDEYRGYEFQPSQTASLAIQGDREWTITVYPVSTRYFKRLQIPGKYQGNGSTVLILDGKYGVATFDTDRAGNFTAWAYGPDHVSDRLFIKTDTDYKGKSVLPIGTKWIVVSANGPWSVDFSPPCCEPPQ